MQEVQVYAVKHKNTNIRMNSRSGGIFTAISDLVLQENGVIYGVVLDDNFSAKHFRAESPSERDKMRGSKYIQSNIGDCFKAVKLDLENGRKVLFTGTSCQIAGLKSYLSTPQSNLLCMDIVCHGVPSPMIWSEYLKYQEKKYHARCLKVDFRNKKDFGWKDHFESLWMQGANGKEIVIHSKIFTKLFYGHNILRPSCYRCPYKSVLHPSDITIADYWGIEKAAPGFSDNKGVSLVLLNTVKGKEFFDRARKSIDCVKCRIEDSLQPPLQGPFPMPPDRNNFWSDFYSKGFPYIAQKYAGDTNLVRIKRKIKQTLLRRKIPIKHPEKNIKTYIEEV